VTRSLLLTLSLLLAAGLAACETEAPADALAVRSLRLTRTGTAYPVVSGVVQNRSATPVAGADVFLTLYDAENLPFPEPGMITVGRLAPGDSSRFEQRLDVQARRVSLRHVSANRGGR
jgi:hypothetical protein